MRSSQDALANTKPWPRSQSMTSFLSLKSWAAIASIQAAKSRPERALSSAKNCASSWRSSAAITSPAVGHVSDCPRRRPLIARFRSDRDGIGRNLLRRQRPRAQRQDAIRFGGNLDVVDLGPALNERTIIGGKSIAGLTGGLHVKRAVEIGKIIDGAVARRMPIGKRFGAREIHAANVKRIVVAGARHADVEGG